MSGLLRKKSAKMIELFHTQACIMDISMLSNVINCSNNNSFVTVDRNNSCSDNHVTCNKDL